MKERESKYSKLELYEFVKEASIYLKSQFNISIDIDGVISQRRYSELVWQRSLVVLYLRIMRQLDLWTIGFAIGGRNHATVIHLLKRAQKTKTSYHVMCVLQNNTPNVIELMRELKFHKEKVKEIQDKLLTLRKLIPKNE